MGFALEMSAQELTNRLEGGKLHLFTSTSNRQIMTSRGQTSSPIEILSGDLFIGEETREWSREFMGSRESDWCIPLNSGKTDGRRLKVRGGYYTIKGDLPKSVVQVMLGKTPAVESSPVADKPASK